MIRHGITSVLLCLSVGLGANGLSPTHAAAQDVVRISGTGGGLAGIRLVADAFNKAHPDTRAKVMPVIGSSGSIKAVIAGELDLGISGRPLRPEERDAGAGEILYARTPFVFVAHKSVPLARITMQEAIDIYSGKTETWPDKSPIRIILRNEGESDQVYLQGISPGMHRAVDEALERKGMIVASTDDDTANILETTPGTFGATTLSLILAKKRPIRVLALGNVTPSRETLSNGSYPYAKPFYLITGKKVTPAALMFIDFIRSRQGESILKRSGHVVVP